MQSEKYDKEMRKIRKWHNAAKAVGQIFDDKLVKLQQMLW